MSSDPASILRAEGLGVDENIFYEKFPVEILDRQVKQGGCQRKIVMEEPPC